MHALTIRGPIRYGGFWAAAMLVSAALGSTPAAAQGDGAGKILKAMSDYLAGQKAISLTFDSEPLAERLEILGAGPRRGQPAEYGPRHAYRRLQRYRTDL